MLEYILSIVVIIVGFNIGIRLHCSDNDGAKVVGFIITCAVAMLVGYVCSLAFLN